ncbi:MAG: LLM class flavin-dependent oxidoreductase [Myxococcota bacterium]
MERWIFHQLETPTPARFGALQRRVRLAESLGIARFWCLPGSAGDGDWAEGAPEIWLAALAGATDRIRLGWGMAGLWPPGLPPVREAEQAAALDVASAGRLDLALLPGPGAATRDPSSIGAVPADATAPAPPNVAAGNLDEGARMLVAMWASETFSWTSARFAVPPIDVVPKPLQRPHPPLWLAGWSVDHARAAGRAGLGLLDVSGGGPSLWQAHHACYVGARAELGEADAAGPGCFAVAVELVEGSELACEARAGRAGPAQRAWLAELEACGVDAVAFRAGFDEGASSEASRPRGAQADASSEEDAMLRIRWFGGADHEGEASASRAANRDVDRTAEGEGR